MKLPRELSGHELVHGLKRFGYAVTRQTGSHMRLTTFEHGEHHITVPAHRALRVGTLEGILMDVARHFDLSHEALLERLFGNSG